jgi:hypothetical protein
LHWNRDLEEDKIRFFVFSNLENSNRRTLTDKEIYPEDSDLLRKFGNPQMIITFNKNEMTVRFTGYEDLTIKAADRNQYSLFLDAIHKKYSHDNRHYGHTWDPEKQLAYDAFIKPH